MLNIKLKPSFRHPDLKRLEYKKDYNNPIGLDSFLSMDTQEIGFKIFFK
jgi:hypothetical protein